MKISNCATTYLNKKNISYVDASIMYNAAAKSNNRPAFTGNSNVLLTENLSTEKFKKISADKMKNMILKDKFTLVSEFTEVIDKFLQGKWNKNLQFDKYNTAVNNLKQILGNKGQGNIAIAQINSISGNVEANSIKIQKYIKTAEEIGLDMIVFPEQALIGDSMENTITRHPVIVNESVNWLNEIAKQTGSTKAVIGFIEPKSSEIGTKKFYNSIAILGDGKIQEIIRKPLISDINTYEYSSYKPIEIQGHKYSIEIPKDDWYTQEYITTNNLIKDKPHAIINCSSSVSRTEKEFLKNSMLSNMAEKSQIPLIYVNKVGATDESSFDGASRVYNSKGELISRAKSFNEQFMIINPFEDNKGKIYNLPLGLDNIKAAQNKFSLNYENDLGRMYESLIQGIKDYFQKNGFKKAVLGLSGGLDSTISAVLLADALGPENVYGISMPSKITSDESKNDAKILAKNLGIYFDEIPIKDMVDSFDNSLNPLFERIDKNWNNKYKESFVQDNLQARSRATILWGISNAFGQTVPIATSDKSEAYMGYATVNGDMSGGFAPLADVTKTKLFALAKWMNRNREVKNAIPEAVIAKPPGAELAIDPKTGKPLIAEDALMPYEFLDEVIWRIENNGESYNEMLDSEFLYEKSHEITKEQKAEWLNKFFNRMSKALYKWSILPPSVIVDSHSINKKEYSQPIASSTASYKKTSEDEIKKKLNFIV